MYTLAHILTAAVFGCCLGALLYYFVRLRMKIGPLLRERFGNRTRQLYWVISILVMIIIANLALLGLRLALKLESATETLGYEIEFAAISLAVGMGLIWLYINRER